MANCNNGLTAKFNREDFRERTRRNTRTKALILQCLKASVEIHITAEEILQKLESQGTPVSKSTVYRFLSQLEEDGALKKYFTGENSPACYQLVTDCECNEHFHLMCKDCGAIVHFDNPSLQKLIRKMDTSNGFSIDIKESPFYGVCQKCKSKQKKGDAE